MLTIAAVASIVTANLKPEKECPRPNQLWPGPPTSIESSIPIKTKRGLRPPLFGLPKDEPFRAPPKPMQGPPVPENYQQPESQRVFTNLRPPSTVVARPKAPRSKPTSPQASRPSAPSVPIPPPRGVLNRPR